MRNRVRSTASGVRVGWEQRRRGVVTKRGVVMALALSLVASMVGVLPILGNGTSAEAAGTQPGAQARLSNTVYAYVRAGESLRVAGDGTSIGAVTSPDGAASSGAGTYGPATQDGVWTVALVSQGSNGAYNWSVDAVADGEVVPGRAWTNVDRLVQPGGADRAADLDYWIVNDTGYVYAVGLQGYNGVNSEIQANSVGWADENCTPTYASFEYDADGIGSNIPGLPDCGETYRVFYEEPAADLPASADTANGPVTVLPPVLGPTDLTVDDLTFSAAAPGTAGGMFTYSINPRFTGGYQLQIDVDGNGSYVDDVDRIVTLGADGSGAYSYEFDGLDGNGEAIADCTLMNARIYFDKLGEVHIAQADVEGRAGGISITRMNGDGAPDASISWNDTGMPSVRTTSTPQLTGESVDSSTGVHGWSYDTYGWGNGRVIDDWAYLPADFGTGDLQIGGQCLSIEKSSDRTPETRVGDTVQYTVRATNTGVLDYTEENPAVVLDDLSGVLDDATYDENATADQPGAVSYAAPLISWTGALPAGETVEVTYSVTLASGGDGVVRNVAWAPEGPEDPTAPACDPPEGGVDPVTGLACAEVEYLLPRLAIEKVADRSELPAIGEDVEYTITITNAGPGDYTAEAPASFTDDLSDVLDAATYNDDAEASAGSISYDEPVLSWEGVLEAGESATVTYTATYTGEGDQNLLNSACVPASEVLPGAQPCDSVRVPGSGLEQWKQVESSDSPAVAGSVLTYTLFFSNEGEAAAAVDAVDDLTHVIDDADVTLEPASEDGLAVARDGERIAITGSVPSGETYTVSYQVTVKADDERGDDVASNFLLAPDEETPDPECVPTDEQLPDCTTTPIAAIAYSKSVEASATPVVEGTVLTYTITIENTGAARGPVSREDALADVLDDAELTSAPVSDTDTVTVSDVVDGRFQIGGELDGRATATVTYEVTVLPDAERGNNEANNFLVLPGGEAECAEGSDQCTSTPMPLIVPTKSADPETGTDVQAGQEVAYTLSFTNVGEAVGQVDYTDHLDAVLDDADLTVAPVSSDPALVTTSGEDGRIRVTGSLVPGQTVTITYTVTVKADGERGDNRLRNVAAKTTVSDPDCDSAGVVCTEHPVGELVSWKTVDPASGTTIEPGAEATYTLHFQNTGEAPVEVREDDVLTRVLDDADVTGRPAPSSDAVAVSEIADGRFTVTGSLAAGETATVSYTVTVKPDGERGDDRLDNFLVPQGEVPAEGPCVPVNPERPDCTVNHVSDVVVVKSSDPASGTEVGPNGEVRYTLTFTNGSTNPGASPTAVDYTDHMSDVLDDAALIAGPTASSEALVVAVEGETIRITGVIASGQTVTVDYTVRAKAYDEQGDHRLGNVVAVTGDEPVCAPESPLCTEHPLVPGPQLPVTGSGLAWSAVAASLLLIVGGGALLATRGRRRQAHEA